MTGEMGYINPETGEDSNGNIYSTHLAIAKEFGGDLKPFDVYQGPYIGLQNGEKLWIIDDEQGLGCRVYRERTETMSNTFHYEDIVTAVRAAKDLFISSMKTFIVPITWRMGADLKIRAETEEEAVDKAFDVELPTGEYLDDSFDVIRG